jgi:hypothetical protein
MVPPTLRISIYYLEYIGYGGDGIPIDPLRLGQKMLHGKQQVIICTKR